MALITCPECNHSVSSAAFTCPSCGYPLKPPPIARKSSGWWWALGCLLIIPVVAYIGLMAAIAIPSFMKARDTAQRNACINNMRQLDAAKEQAALEHSYREGDTIPEKEIDRFLKNGFGGLQCPGGGKYTIHSVGQEPECSIHGKLSEASTRRPMPAGRTGRSGTL
jgi:hypothetical protein